MTTTAAPHPHDADPRALLVTKVDQDVKWLEGLLGNAGYSLRRAETGRQAREWAREQAPDLVLVGAQLDHESGVELCRALRAADWLSPLTPLVLVNPAPATRAERLDALRGGAWDCVDARCDYEEMLLRLEGWLATKARVDASALQGLLDPLTGLYNRQGIARRAREIGAEAFRRRVGMVCGFFAVDVGVGAGATREHGDRVAKRCAEALRKHGRPSDALGRVSSAQFAIVAAAPDAGAAAALMDRLAARLDDVRASAGQELPRFDLRIAYELAPNLRYAPIDPIQLIGRVSSAIGQAVPRRRPTPPPRNHPPPS